jgi:TDG/mug DNA glycosylase family protein
MCPVAGTARIASHQHVRRVVRRYCACVLPDYLGPGLTVVFVGTSVSMTSAELGHYYSNPTNKFWQLLAVTELLGEDRLAPRDDARVLAYGIGLTDIVKGRAASSDAILAATDFDVPGFVTKIHVCRPCAVAFNGARAATAVARHLGWPRPTLGPASWNIGDACVYLLPSSSGAAAIGTQAKTRAWAEFGAWLRTRCGNE